MAEGFRRAGLPVTMAFDWDAEARASYEANHGHAPVGMDVRDLERLLRDGWSPGPVDLFVADPPCTPWSRAGKRKGTGDGASRRRRGLTARIWFWLWFAWRFGPSGSHDGDAARRRTSRRAGVLNALRRGTHRRGRSRRSSDEAAPSLPQRVGPSPARHALGSREHGHFSCVDAVRYELRRRAVA
jgi:hypothetical protein